MIIKSIIDAMSQAIYSEFGEDYRIYTEAVEQGLETPCFFISCTSTSEEEKLMAGTSEGRLLRSQVMQVYYFPQSDDYKGEYNDVTDRLYEALNYITTDEGLIRGTNMNSEVKKNTLRWGSDTSSQVQENILSFVVTYKFPVLRVSDEAVKMKELYFNRLSKYPAS